MNYSILHSLSGYPIILQQIKKTVAGLVAGIENQIPLYKNSLLLNHESSEDMLFPN